MATKGARARKRQTKISFSAAANPSPSTKSPTIVEPSAAPMKSKKTTPKKAVPRRSKRAPKHVQTDSSSEDELATQSKRAMQLSQPVNTPNGMFGSSDVDSVISSDSSEEEKEEQHRENPPSRKRQRTASSSAGDDNHEPAVTILPRKRQRIVEVKGQETSEEEEAPRTQSRRQATRRHSTPEDSIEVQTPPRSTRRRITRRPSSSPEEDDVLVVPRQRNQTNAHVHSGSEEDSEAPQHTRRRISRGTLDSESEDQNGGGQENDAGIQSDGTEQDDEQDELKEDLAFLRSSPLPDRGRLRSIHGKPKNERQKALEALKRKRAGINNEPSSSSTPNRKKPVVVDTDSDSELEVIKEEPENDEQIDDQLEGDNNDQEGDACEANALDIFQESEDDIEFIDDNADAVIGEPIANADLDDMRLAFSLSRAKTKHLFKHAVEWMVMKKIHPGFDANRSFYTLTFRKLDDEVNALAGSKFTSSAWTPDFTRAVRARPDMIANDISYTGDIMSPHCAACNRKNHPATWELMLTGQPYDKDTLEPLEHNTSSDSDSDSDSSSSNSSLSASPAPNANTEKPERDSAGDILLPESHRYYLGSTCKANAHVSHTLYHWRYHLYQWVKQHLAQQGHLTAEKIVKRDKWSDRKREKAAMKIVDKMESDGEISKLWHLYKEQVAFAVQASNEYKEGWGRRRR